MNILTKICVVLLVVASLVALPVFVSLAMIQPNYRTLFEKECQAYKLLDAKSKEYAESATHSKAALIAAMNAAGTEKLTLQTQRDNALTEIHELKLKLIKSENRFAEMSASLITLTKSDKSKAKRIEQYLDKIQKSWDRETKLQKELVETQDQWKQQQSRAERLAQNNRVLKEQSENMRQQNIELTQKVKDMEASGLGREDADVTLTPETKMAGTITAVRNNIASINIGSAHGLKKGMELIVFRGGQYVGKLKIERVDANESAGIMTKKILTPMQGDKVTSNLN